MDHFSVYNRRPSCDTLALAMCDPGLRRRGSSECEEDSLPEVYVDSGLSTLRRSHGGYDSEQEARGQDEDEEGKHQGRSEEDDNNNSMLGENSDTEVKRRENHDVEMPGATGPDFVSTSQPAETQDGESAFGSDSSSVLDWKPSEPVTVSTPPAPTARKALSAITVQVRQRRRMAGTCHAYI